MKKINFKSNAGFTMQDLVAAIIILLIFTGVIGTSMYKSLKTNLQTKMAGTANNYAIEILEDIDKIPYEDVVNGMESKYKGKFDIPSNYKLNIDVSNYNEGTSKEDLIKEVKLTITYELAGSQEKLVIERLKVKEV